MTYRILLALAGAVTLTACQSGTTGQAGLMAASTPATTEREKPAKAEATTATAYAAAPRASAGQCAIKVAGGPPPKPDKGSDFAKNAVGKNLARNVGRNAISNIAGSIAGPLGGAIGSAVAVQAIRTEQDLHGTWTLTDGSPTCGCEIEITTGAGLVPAGYFRSSGYRLKDAKGGRVSNVSCSNPLLASARSFALGYSFTGYDAKLALQTSGGSGVGLLNRDGMNYFSGTLADGTPVTMWRRE
ncbi:hypothetical protein CSC94_02365 [Zhengella mangrovi]|uniref:Alkaline proteinase inhibitor/ Outer membrane lipoprotein Omp19 domain-containing protein n=1 Tax=Zhengella mangrovi TaxID=1982044 RepID=A0A2G1QTH5_9HYPH|nr:hypothetical protein [Zhengella mangrovi]PHP68856.1 hypothetical protein CSC94_02365 [Zhengella mangrovi]